MIIMIIVSIDNCIDPTCSWLLTYCPSSLLIPLISLAIVTTNQDISSPEWYFISAQLRLPDLCWEHAAAQYKYQSQWRNLYTGTFHLPSSDAVLITPRTIKENKTWGLIHPVVLFDTSRTSKWGLDCNSESLDIITTNISSCQYDDPS